MFLRINIWTGIKAGESLTPSTAVAPCDAAERLNYIYQTPHLQVVPHTITCNTKKKNHWVGALEGALPRLQLPASLLEG